MQANNKTNFDPIAVSYLKKYGLTLIKNGYAPIPIKRGSKIPAIKGWQKIKATQSDVEKWGENSSFGSIGMLTALNPAVDIDCLDEEVKKKVVEYCEKEIGTAPKRVGLPPKTLLVYRTKKPFKKIQSPSFEDHFGKRHKVEILGKGQQFVAFGVHPDTKKPYEWLGDSVRDIPQDMLPLITEEQAQGVLDYFVSIIPEDWIEVEKGTQPKSMTSEDFLNNCKPPCDIKSHEIQQALSKVNPDDSYDRWVKTGMALHHQFNGSEEGFEHWNNWSSQGLKYKEGECEEKWPTFAHDFKSGKPTTFATVLKWAKEVDNGSYFSSRPISIDCLELQQKLGPINWLVKGFIESDTVGLFFGDPGSFKSFIAMDIAYHIASGRDWCGNKVKKGPVYYIAGEGHGGLARRQEAWFHDHKPDLSDLSFRYTTGAMDFHNEETAQRVNQDIEDWAKTVGNPSLIVIDTLARNFNADENSSEDIGLFINNVNNFLRVPFGSVVLIVHHTGHSEKKRARGSIALKAGVDFEYRVEKIGPLIAKLTCTKMKDAVEPDVTGFQGKKVMLNWPSEGEELIDSLVFEKTSVVEQERPLRPELNGFLDLARELVDSEGIVDRVQLRERAIADGIARNFTQVRSYISALKNKNLIEVISNSQIRL